MWKFLTRVIKFFVSRAAAALILIIIQLALFYSVLYRITLAYELNQLLDLLAFCCVIYIINKDEDASYKIAWITVILLLPLFGTFMYLLCAGRKMPKRLSLGTIHAEKRMQDLLRQDETVLEDLEKKMPYAARLFEPARRTSNFPVYGNTSARYFSSGEEFLPVFLEELEKAEKFIFMEYFIIGQGSVWDEVLEVLKRKISEGVEVKLIYDDFGCIDKLPSRYDRKLNEMGIETFKFNRVRPALIIQMNNRDHRKICVIDNRVGFTGGVNLADEYMNRIVRFGYWRDSAIMLKGDAVRSMTDMFLGMYTYLKKAGEDIDYSRYLGEEKAEGQGWFQAFSDTPTDDTDTCLAVHLNLINHARKYLYIDTPYLVLNQDMRTALTLAAASGVDVRILVPGVPDKRIVNSITRGNYLFLIKAGVRIYEYTPGFNHSKNIVCDDEAGLVGSINTDYRSYFLHFEDGVLICGDPVIGEMKKDFLKALESSREVSREECESVNRLVRTFRALLRVFAPLF